MCLELKACLVQVVPLVLRVLLAFKDLKVHQEHQEAWVLRDQVVHLV